MVVVTKNSYLDGTYFVTSGPIPLVKEVKALCPDGKVHSVSRLHVRQNQVRGSVKINGKNRAGFVKIGEDNVIHFVVKTSENTQGL